MKVIVQEYPEDENAVVWLIDLDKIDPNNTNHLVFKDLIEAAINDDLQSVSCSYDYYHPDVLMDLECGVPNHFDHSVTIFLDRDV